MAPNTRQEAGVVKIDINGRRSFKQGVVRAQDLEICQHRQKTNAFGVVVGGREAMYRTKAHDKILQVVMDGPAKGQMRFLEVTIRSTENGRWGGRCGKRCSRHRRS